MEPRAGGFGTGRQHDGWPAQNGKPGMQAGLEERFWHGKTYGKVHEMSLLTDR